MRLWKLKKGWTAFLNNPEIITQGQVYFYNIFLFGILKGKKIDLTLDSFGNKPLLVFKGSGFDLGRYRGA